MKDFAILLEGLAALAWPAIIILLIFMFRPLVAALVESAQSRKFTLKIGGQELTMEEANQQQRILFADIQAEVVELRKMIEGVMQPILAEPEATLLVPTSPNCSILWVDDQPKNNSYFVQQLSDKGVKVDLALSTSEGLRLFDKETYGVIISDMGRTEDGLYKATAGIELLRKVREQNRTVPFIIFCSSRRARENKESAISLGATGITSSTTELLGLLQTVVKEMKV